MRKILIYITLIIIVLGSCKKVELPEPMNGTPVFSVNAMIDNDSINWVAGDDDFYMFTTFSKDSLDIYTLKGQLKKDTMCVDDCERYISFSIRGNAITPVIDAFNIDDVIKDSDYKYASNTSSTISIMNGFQYFLEATLIDSFFQNQQINSVDWMIQTGNNTQNFFGNNIVFTTFENDDLDLTMDIQTNTGCTARLKQFIPIGLPNDCGLDLALSGDSMNGYSLNASFFNSNQVDTFIWNGNLDSSIISLNPNILSGSQISLNAFNSDCNLDLDICFTVDSIVQFELESLGIPNLNYNVQPVVDTMLTNDFEQFSKIEISYSDGSAVYRSRLGENSNNTFTISEIEDFEDNELGYKTKKFKVGFGLCEVVSASGDAKMISGEGIIAVAYPD